MNIGEQRKMMTFEPLDVEPAPTEQSFEEIQLDATVDPDALSYYGDPADVGYEPERAEEVASV